MKKLPVVSSDDVIKALKKGGFEYAPKRGKREDQRQSWMPPNSFGGGAAGTFIKRHAMNKKNKLAHNRIDVFEHCSSEC